MLTPKRPAEAMASWVLRLFSTQTSTSGGWRESEANDDTVMPYGFPSYSVVTIVTPLAKCDMACLKSASLMGMSAFYPTRRRRISGGDHAQRTYHQILRLRAG